MTKIYVTDLPGGGGALGMIDAKVGMQTQRGVIAAIEQVHPSGEVAYISSSGGYPTAHWIPTSGIFPSSGVTAHYLDELYTTQTHVTNVWSWPSGDGSIQFGHSSLGAQVYNPTPGSGAITVMVAGTPTTVYR